MLKQALCEAVERTAFDEKAPKVVMADASQVGSVSVTVHQLDHENKRQLLGCWSRKLSDTEQRYTVTELELMAIREGMENFRWWLHGCPHEIKVYSDHSALLNLMTLPLDPKPARWVMDLCQYRFSIEHIPGRENRAADALSRAGTHGKKVESWGFEHPEWFAPSGVTANEVLAMSQAELWRRYGEPLIGEDQGMKEAWEKYKRTGTASTLKDLVSLLIRSSNIS
jgi:ribonuclease HI